MMMDEYIEKQILITGTKPINEADPGKLIFDIYRIHSDQYPDSIKFYARVYDSSGHFITNMANPYKLYQDVEYFVALNEELGKHYNIRKENVPVFNVREYGSGDSIPFHIALSVDKSGSMTPVMDAINEGTEIFIDLKYPYDNIALASFHKDFLLKAPLQDNKEELKRIFHLRKNQGSGPFSSVREALVNSIRIFERAPIDEPRILVIFTDGDDNFSKRKTSEIISSAKRNNINIFIVAFGYPKDGGLKEIAANTGGKYYQIYTKAQMVDVFKDIYLSLRYYYLYTYHPPKF
jgi:hypothetical protein